MQINKLLLRAQLLFNVAALLRQLMVELAKLTDPILQSRTGDPRYPQQLQLFAGHGLCTAGSQGQFRDGTKAISAEVTTLLHRERRYRLRAKVSSVRAAYMATVYELISCVCGHKRAAFAQQSRDSDRLWHATVTLSGRKTPIRFVTALDVRDMQWCRMWALRVFSESNQDAGRMIRGVILSAIREHEQNTLRNVADPKRRAILSRTFTDLKKGLS